MRVATLLFSLLFIIASSTSAQPPSAFEGQLTFTGGVTRVDFSNDFTGAARELGLNVSPLFGGGLRKASANFPITFGTVDGSTLRGEILHSGSLIIQRQNAAVKLGGFIIDTTGPQPFINGLASVNGSVVGRIPLFDLDLGSAQISQNGAVLTIANVGVTLRSEAAGALNGVFGTAAFVQGLNIGNATVSGIIPNRVDR